MMGLPDGEKIENMFTHFNEMYERDERDRRTDGQKVKVWTLAIAPLTRVRLVTSSALLYNLGSGS